MNNFCMQGTIFITGPIFNFRILSSQVLSNIIPILQRTICTCYIPSCKSPIFTRKYACIDTSSTTITQFYLSKNLFYNSSTFFCGFGISALFQNQPQQVGKNQIAKQPTTLIKTKSNDDPKSHKIVVIMVKNQKNFFKVFFLKI